MHFEGKPCRSCEGTLRYLSTGRCVLCSRTRVSAWRKANPEVAKETNRRWYAGNLEASRKHSRKWHHAHPDRSALKSRIGRLRRRFGITIADYDNLLASQGGVCAICSTHCPTGRKLAVDHCHTTGKVRGLLCVPCNTAIGKLREDPGLLIKAASYVLAHLIHEEDEDASRDRHLRALPGRCEPDIVG